MTKHRIDLRLTTTEAFERLHWLFTATHLKDVVQETIAGFSVEDALFFKCRERICETILLPAVAVVTRAVATSKDMPKAVCEKRVDKAAIRNLRLHVG